MIGKVGAGETALVGLIVGLDTLATIDVGVMGGATNPWAKEVSACNSESSADESMGVVDASELSDTSGAAGVMRVSVAGSATGIDLSANGSSLAEVADFFSARDFSVAAKDVGVSAGKSVSVAASELGRDAFSRLGVCTEGITACEVIGSSDIFFLRS